MDDVPKNEFSGEDCYNCNFGEKGTDILHNIDGTEMDSIVGWIICQKDQQRHSVSDSCDKCEQRSEESQQLKP